MGFGGVYALWSFRNLYLTYIANPYVLAQLRRNDSESPISLFFP
ncbi:hypothetical protein [Vibrio vulnificus YJ016]|uniref:Uncharacterized protein n=1 Tax=Vibrio vulnificus (strain YJ016) TaxID=196600 RepID=Q7MQH6_VIBVY|nr:hypothetical protein [Vibrio vulnificus YJ016]